jgi:cytochrome c biogenesis protein CcmG, thiol:disulfide interchange protein DsbE
MSEQARRRPRIAPFIALGIAVVIGVFVVVLARSSSNDADAVSSFRIGKPAPQVVSTTIDDEPFDLARRRGSWVVLNFFNSTCVPCKAEHGDLVQFVEQQRELGAAGAELYTIAQLPDDDEKVRQFFADNGGDWPAVRDYTGTIAVAFGTALVPETWIIDPNGIVRQRFPGQVDFATLATEMQRLRASFG